MDAVEQTFFCAEDLLSETLQRVAGREGAWVEKSKHKGVDFATNVFRLREDGSSEKLEDFTQRMRAALAAVLPDDVLVSNIGPFINFNLPNALLGQIAGNISVNPKGGIQQEGQKTMVEYFSPNTNKPAHLGHLRNLALGNSLSRILRFAGHEVVEANLVNDRGAHICKSMLAYLVYGNGETPESTGEKGDHFVGKYYVMFEKMLREEIRSMGLSEEDGQKAPMNQKIAEMLRKWEEGDEETLILWRKMNDWVLAGFGETLDRMGIKFDAVYYESDTYKLGKDIIEAGLKNGVLKISQNEKIKGAVVADLKCLGLGEGEKVLLRGDGTSVYMTQDLGTAELKFTEHGLDNSIYVVADEQRDHFKVLFGILKVLGYQWADNCTHFSYGMVNLPHGRMKSREGTVVDADDLLNELRDKIKETVSSKGGGEKLDEVECDLLGQAALNFYLLSARPNSTLKFNPEESVNFEGKTGPYVMYQYVRTNKILRNGEEVDLENVDYGLLIEPSEHNLLMALTSFTQKFRAARKNLDQTIISEFVYELATTFSKFYTECRILNAETDDVKKARLALCKMTNTLLAQGMDLLGIRRVEKM